MKALPLFTPMVALHTPGAPDILIEHYVRQSAIQFCDRTKVVKEALEAEMVGADGLYDLPPNTVAVELVYVDGEPISPISEDQLRVDSGNWKTRTGKPTSYVSSLTQLRLYPLPGENVQVEVTVATRPGMSSSSIDDILYGEWFEAIVSGAIMSIAALPGQTYSNPDVAQYHRALFEHHVVSAQAKALKQTGYAPLRVVPA
jgi:hypothetical protein